MSAQNIQYFIDEEIWNNYSKFVFDRNPFDKTFSLYFYMGGEKKYSNFKNFINREDIKYLDSFENYTINGKIAVDRIYKFENIEESLSDLKLQIGVDQINLPTKKAKGGLRKTKSYHDIYDDYTKRFIEVFQAREIELLDYKF